MKHFFISLVFTCAFLSTASYLFAQEIDTAYYDDGAISSIGSYDSKGREIGLWVYYRENGYKIREGEYKKGNHEGEWLMYGKDGELEEIWLYKKNDLLEKTLPDGSPVIESLIEKMPMFPGGDSALMAYLGSQIHYPKDAIDAGAEGQVYVTFIVGTDGAVSDINIVDSVHPSMDKEVIRVIRNMPRWNPGMQYGKQVKVQYNLPINFNLPKK